MDDRVLLAALNGLVNDEPFCPTCGGTNGHLGTSGAYFSCRDCPRLDKYRFSSQFWCCQQRGRHYINHCPHTWAESVAASPWGRWERDR